MQCSSLILKHERTVCFCEGVCINSTFQHNGHSYRYNIMYLQALCESMLLHINFYVVQMQLNSEPKPPSPLPFFGLSRLQIAYELSIPTPAKYHGALNSC